jgi:hypothetical protein
MRRSDGHHRGGVALAALLALLPGCWAKFPEELLIPDAGPDLRYDLRHDQRRDVPADRPLDRPSDWAPDASADLRVDRASDRRSEGSVGDRPITETSTVDRSSEKLPTDKLAEAPRPDGVCTATHCCSSANCSAPTPLCDPATRTCRQCLTNADCTATGGLCTLGGTCPSTSEVSVVDGSQTCPGKGSKGNPFCSIALALAATPKYILVRSGTYPAITIDKSKDLYGASPQTTIIGDPATCPSLQITSGAAVVAAGFTVRGGVLISGSSTEAMLVQDAIGPSATCVGVTSAGGSVGPVNVTVRSSVLSGNLGGGLLLDGRSFEVVNSFIVENGTSSSSLGGASLKWQPASVASFVNNTVAGNVWAGGTGSASGVYCDPASTPAVTLVNSIIWGNTGTPQWNSACNPGYCDLEGGTTTDNNKITTCFGSGTIIPSKYNIVSGSDCQDAANTIWAPADDYYGTPRLGLPDIGAHERP